MNKPKAIITVGCSASGKSTYAKELVKEEFIQIERDLIRRDLFPEAFVDKSWSGYKFNRHNEQLVTNEANRLIEEAFNDGKNIVISDTNINPKYRDRLVDFLNDTGFDVYQKFIYAHYNELLDRNKGRPYEVPVKVISDQWDSLVKQGFIEQPERDNSLMDAVIVDIDGTLAEMNGRSPFDWDRVDEDFPKRDVIDIVQHLSSSNHIVVMSGRDSICREKTFNWLRNNGVNFNWLIMRPKGSQEKDWKVKKELYIEKVLPYYNVKFVIDDRPQVVRMWRKELGLDVMCVGDIDNDF